MFSIKGVYKGKKFHLEEPLNIEKRANVIITFLDVEAPIPVNQEISLDVSEEDHSEEYYEKLRKHKRYPAKGNISLIIEKREVIYPLRDYSAGGLSFLSDQTFEVKCPLTASLKDPIEKDVSVLDFEFEVARVIAHGDKYIIGCKFFDDVDEELWHSLIS
ncbi:MAG: hypothetical protein COB67_13105 [SAR324 cluster bacterium]|uniref:PilZ domain-containing protein n=1 Tax=SAR324 cluster bacterium TaxID=2024889 RepID=A0A2A4SPH4_9DELT|nr:MAG: hypothetical protein COB67_13105 [SAR324 cluster bacterium]